MSLTNNPNFALIPSGYKEGKIYSVLPSDGDGDFTNFQRRTQATRINSQGLIELVDRNVPRLNYTFNQQGGCPYFLIEDFSTNLIKKSQELDSTLNWKPYSAGSEGLPIVTSNQGISPDGTLNADLVSFPTSSQVVNIQFRQRVTTTANTTYTFSFYAKVKTGNSQTTIGLLFGSQNVDNILITEEWQRIEYTDIIEDGGNKWFGLKKINHSVQKDFYFWGFQLEQKENETQLNATSYIPNYSDNASYTRAEETFSGTNAFEINPNAGLFFLDIKRGFNNKGAEYNTLTLANDIESKFSIYFQEYNDRIGIYIRIDGRFVFSNVTYTNSEDLKFAVQWGNNSVVTWLNGVKQNTELITEIITINEASLRPIRNGSELSRFYGGLKDLRVYNEDLTDKEIEILTTL